MSKPHRAPLETYLSLHYSFDVIAGEHGGYVILFPDLPGCMTQVRTLDEVGPMAEEIRLLWIETAYEMGQDIPPPSVPEEYSGRLHVRLPKSLHGALARAAERDGLSLNTHICALLARNDALGSVERRFDALEARLDAMERHLRYSVVGVPAAPNQRARFRFVDEEYEGVAA